MRLKPLREFRSLLEEPGKFLLVPGEEISATYAKSPVHVTAINVRDVIPAAKGGSVAETVDVNLRAVGAQRQKAGWRMIAVLNHPNFGWGVRAEDMVLSDQLRFFEVFNGHPTVRNYGDDLHASTERIWDVVLALRLGRHKLPVVYGVATDDAHGYHEFGPGKVNPGRGWVMVRARHLTAEAVVRGLAAGDFYATSGVTLDDFGRKGNVLSLAIRGEPGIAYKTQVVGTGRVDVVRTGRSGSLEVRQNLHYRHGSTEYAVREYRQGRLSLLLNPEPTEVAFLGLGTGSTAAPAVADRDVQRAVVVELIPKVVEASRLPTATNLGVTDHPKVEVRVDDARHYLLRTRRFDAIVSDLFVPRREPDRVPVHRRVLSDGAAPAEARRTVLPVGRPLRGRSRGLGDGGRQLRVRLAEHDPVLGSVQPAVRHRGPRGRRGAARRRSRPPGRLERPAQRPGSGPANWFSPAGPLPRRVPPLLGYGVAELMFMAGLCRTGDDRGE